MYDALPPSIDVLKDLLTGGAVAKLTLLKASLDTFNAYQQRRDLEALEQFAHYLAEKIGNMEQLLSERYLATPDGNRFAHKIVAAATDPKIAEKREVFANALINGARSRSDGEIGELDLLRFTDLLISLSAASLEELALIHKYCEPKLLAEKDLDMATVEFNLYRDALRPKFMGDSGGAAHYHNAVLRELKSAGLFARVRYQRMPDGSAKLASMLAGEDNYYTTYTRDFARFASTPTKPTEKDA